MTAANRLSVFVVDYVRLSHDFVIAIDLAGIDEEGAVLLVGPTALMNVSEHVNSWLHLKDALPQKLAACLDTINCRVEDTERRAMSDEYVDVRYAGPDMLLFVRFVVECRVVKVHRMGRSEDPDALDFDVLMLEVDTVLAELLLGFFGSFQLH